ncbi:MAG: hypothetical protein VX317_06455, partial [Verrucomicrobiota bacterium]|nr:hypothetical protein [Verrucomicrobiota bacterium]
MKGPPCQLSAVLFAGGYLLALGGCGKTAGPDTTREQDGPEVAYFSPHPGETWKYKVQKEIPIELRLSEADAALRPQLTDTAHLITFEQIRTCTGEREIEALGKTLTTIAISENGKVMGEELYQLGPEGILSWGWIPANVKNGEAHLLEEGVAIATPDMQPGQTWEWLGRDSGNPFLFRVIERGMVTVPAGTFQATRIQITSEKISPHPVTGDDHVTYLKRSLWFAKNVGVIKEDIVYYGEQHVRVRQ